MEFSRQESWGGQPFPCPEDLLGPWKEPRSAALPGDSLSEPPGKPHFLPYSCLLEVSVYQAGPSELSFFCLFILFMGFSRQEYWSGLPFPSPIDHILSKLPTMTCLSWVAHEIKRCLFLGRKAMTNLDSILKSRDITLTTKVHLVKAMVFPDVRESWALKSWCFWTVVLKKTLESPLDCKEIHPVHPKGNQSWVFIGRTDDEAEAESSNTLATWCEELTHWKRP